MAGLGIIATGAAFLNYRKAKAEYDTLMEKKSELDSAVALLAANINQYNEHKYDDQHERPVDTKPNDMPDGVKVTTVLRVANLVGKTFYAKVSVVIANQSTKAVYIRKTGANCSINDMPVVINEKLNLNNFNLFDPNSLPGTVQYEIPVDKYIQPGEVLYCEGVVGYSVLANRTTGEITTGEIRSIVCEACGKRLITSCPKINIEGAQKADIDLWWSEDEKSATMHGYWIGMPGVLRYCGEAGLS